MHIFITGSSSGIGLAITEKFLKEGHAVTGFDKNPSAINHPNYVHYIGDVRDKETYPEIEPVDILINNAGVQGDDDIAVNLKGVIDITERYGIHESVKAVLMIGSASAHSGSEFPEYAASKGGVLAYTKNVALRIAQYGATCNSLDFGGDVLKSLRILAKGYGAFLNIGAGNNDFQHIHRFFLKSFNNLYIVFH